MSCGFTCKLCGFYESVHQEPSIAADFLFNDNMEAEDIKPGYTKSYATCSGYKSEDQEAEDAANAALKEAEFEQGRVVGLQTYVWMVTRGNGRPFIYVSDDCRG